MTETLLEPDQNLTGQGTGQTQTRHKPTPASKLAIKTDYVHGLGNLRTLADRHNLNQTTVFGWCQDEDWVGQRQRWLESQDKKLTQPEPEPAPQPAQVTASLDPRARQIETLIDKAITAFELADEPREMQALAQALDRLYQTWALLTGHEKPGIRKTKPAKSRSGTVPVPEPE